MNDDNQIMKQEEQMETSEDTLDPRVNDPGFWKEIWEQIRLVWYLIKDKEVPGYLKLLPLAAVFYVLLPTDLIPDLFVPFGQLDDLTAVLVGAKMFIEMSPQDIVNRYIYDMRIESDDLDLENVDPSDKEIDASIIIEGDYTEIED